MHFSSPPYMLHILPNSSSLIRSAKSYFVSSSSNEATLQSLVTSTLLGPHSFPSKVSYCQNSEVILLTSRDTPTFTPIIIHSIVCLTNPQPLPKPVVHTARSTASSFNFQCPLFSLRSSTSCLRLLPRIPVTSNFRYIFPSETCFRRQFLSKM